MELNKTEKIELILKKLHDEEEAENKIIWLYETLISLDFFSCIDESKREIFQNGVDILYKDSIKHREMIQEITKNYS